MPPAPSPVVPQRAWQRVVGLLLALAGAAVLVLLLLVVLPVPTAVGVVGAVLVLGAAAVVAVQDGPVLAPADQDRPGTGLPTTALSAGDLSAVRLSMALRGYRMSEVDEVLDRLGAELAERDTRLALQEQQLAEQEQRLASQAQRLAGQETLFAELRERAARREG